MVWVMEPTKLNGFPHGRHEGTQEVWRFHHVLSDGSLEMSSFHHQAGRGAQGLNKFCIIYNGK